MNAVKNIRNEDTYVGVRSRVWRQTACSLLAITTSSVGINFADSLGASQLS